MWYNINMPKLDPNSPIAKLLQDEDSVNNSISTTDVSGQKQPLPNSIEEAVQICEESYSPENQSTAIVIEQITEKPKTSSSFDLFINNKIEEAQNKPAKVARKASTKKVKPTAAGERQPTRREKTGVDRNRLFDTTQLKAEHHGYFVHRDYAAHFFRWGWVSKMFNTGRVNKILDVGCGQDIPLARVMMAPGIYQTCQPEYWGVDLNKISNYPNAKWIHVLDEFNFCERYHELCGSKTPNGEIHRFENSCFDFITNFEVIEHMTVEWGFYMLQCFAWCLKAGGKLILSTPVFNGQAANNHVHEYTIEELQGYLNQAGFTVLERHGTFASLHDIKKVCTEEERQVMEDMRSWFGNDVVSCFLAYKYPDASRNNVWVCARTMDVQAGLHGDL